MISIYLSILCRLYFCSSEKFIGRALPENVFQSKNGRIKSFLQALYSSTPFATLFKDVPSNTDSTDSGPRLAGKNQILFGSYFSSSRS